MGIAEFSFVSLFGVIYLAAVVYLLVLATRFVRAVERIADRMNP